MTNYFAQLKQLFARMTLRQRLALGGIAALAVVGLGAVIYFANEPEYGVLFSDLRPEDAVRITERLKQEKVVYRVAAGGTMISVPAEKVSEMRLQTAGAGLLAGGHVGFELFDKTSFGATDFTEQINYKRALEGELARTVEGLGEVAQARVHLTLPRESLFAEREQRAKASVVLRLKPGRALPPSAANSIAQLLASSVEGLEPNNVTVLDAQGQTLSAKRSGGEEEVTLSHLELKQKFERDLAQRLVLLLEPVVGAGRVRADVNALMDFTRNEQTEENYDPQKVAIRSKQMMEESGNGTGTAASGIPGTRSNAPPTPTPTPTPTPAPGATPAATPAAAQPSPTPSSAARGATRSSETTNYEVSKLTRHTIDATGNIKRLSVSVLVDNQAPGAGGNPASQPAAGPARSKEEMQQINELVSAAVGADAQRGDQVVVRNIAFNAAESGAVPSSFWERNRDLLKLGIKYGAMLLVALMIMLFVVRPMRKALVVPAEAKELAAGEARLLSPAAASEGGPEALPVTRATGLPAASATASANNVSGKSAAMTPGSAPAAGIPLADEDAIEQLRRLEAEIEAGLDAEAAAANVNRAAILKRRLVEQAERDPEVVVQTIRNWLQEAEEKKLAKVVAGSAV